MLKKIIISFIIFNSLASSAFADEDNVYLKKGIENYKKGDYLSTIQKMEKVIEDNEGSSLGYYYMAISHVKIGNIDKAMDAYEKVIILDPNSQLANYARIGRKLLNQQNNNSVKKTPAKFKFSIKEKGFFSKNVEEDINQRNLKFLLEKINTNQEINPSEYEKFKDFSPDKLNNKPSKEEIAKAYQVLSKAGIHSPSQNYGINPEMMQMSLLASSFGGMGGQMGGQQQGNSNSMNMLPLMMMMQAQQGEKNIDPEFMQTMMTNMMMPNMMNLYENKNY